MKDLSQFFQLIQFSPNMDILVVGEIDNFIPQLQIRLDEVGGEVIQKEFSTLTKTHKYEYAIVVNDIDTEHLKLCRDVIGNRGHIILLLENIDKFDAYQALEIADFGAINAIELFEDIEVVMAIKVHMWGMD